MNYRLRNKPKSKHRTPLISVLVLFVLLSLSASFFPKAVRTGFYDVSRPLWSLGRGASKSFLNVKNFFILKSALVSENLSLQDEISNLRLKQFDYGVLLQENQDLKGQLGRSAYSSRVISRILSKPPISLYDTFVIDAGSSDGILLGNKVYSSDTIIIGLIKEVTSHISLVQLFSSGNQKQQATLLRTGASFILEGQGGANFKLEVPKETDVLWGDVFVYPSLSSSVIGSVYYIDTNSQSAFKTLYLRVPGNVFSSQFVFVEKNQ